jgi:hypothetical protein
MVFGRIHKPCLSAFSQPRDRSVVSFPCCINDPQPEGSQGVTWQAISDNEKVFGVTDDPVKLGLVANLARPGGNATCINFLVSEAVPKRLGLLRDLVPGAVRVAAMVNAGNVVSAETTVREMQKRQRLSG